MLVVFYSVSGRSVMPKSLSTFAVLTAFTASFAPALAGGGNVAVIDNGGGLPLT